MADTALPDLPTEATSVAADDWVYIVDRSDTTDSADGTSKPLQFSNLYADFFETRSDGNIGTGRQYLFMDQAAWSTGNGGAAVADANNFHFYDTGLCRVEFETDNEMQFYIEGGASQDAWYGLQESSTTHWSFGQRASDGGNLFFCAGFALDANPEMKLTKTGNLEVSGSITAGDGLIVTNGPFTLDGDSDANSVATITNLSTSSAGAGGGLRLRHNDGAAMGSGHRLGFVLFAGADNASDGFGYASGFESFATEAWSGSAQGANFVINVTADGANSRSAALTLTSDQATVESAQIEMGSGGPIWLTGSGTPESSVTADVGSLYTRTDGGASTTLYVKESGTGNTGWVAK